MPSNQVAPLEEEHLDREGEGLESDEEDHGYHGAEEWGLEEVLGDPQGGPLEDVPLAQG